MGGRCIGGGMMGGRGCCSCCRACGVQNISQGPHAMQGHAKQKRTPHWPCTVRPASCPRHLSSGQPATGRATSGHHGLGRTAPKQGHGVSLELALHMQSRCLPTESMEWQPTVPQAVVHVCAGVAADQCRPRRRRQLGGG